MEATEAATGAAEGGNTFWSPEEVEDISEASGMEAGELGEDPRGAMVFGSPNDEQRGRGTRRNRCEEEEKKKTTSAENAGLIARRKSDKEREVEKRRAGTTEGELGKATSERKRSVVLRNDSLPGRPGLCEDGPVL
ncbi:hypothetical protein KUCAC02_015943 [Chaenocephalus aceratus]|uniref:Uncharacterized protein n=1 Tax=Chaenocephalus aceratus TaxID=36190 RepID=A0ACB9XZX1_CHAAC|nr:hypothetical protein KUCAC02_015943 [Chaenocephalus aceratus]